MVAWRGPAAALALAACCAVAASCSSTAKRSGVPAGSGGGDAGGPLTVETTTWRFGSIERGETVTHTIRLTNEGEEPLAVSAHSSCGCLTAGLDREVLPPGETAELRLSFTGETIAEKVTKTVYVDASGPAAQRIVLTVTGEVTRGDAPYLYTTPSMLLVEKKVDAYEPARLRVANRGGGELEVTEVRCFGCVASPGRFTLGADEEVEIEVGLAEAWTGRERWLEIDSNDPVGGTRKVPLVVAD